MTYYEKPLINLNTLFVINNRLKIEVTPDSVKDMETLLDGLGIKFTGKDIKNFKRR